MSLLIIYFLFISFFISFFFGRYFNRKSIGIYTSFCVFISLCISIFSFIEIGLKNNPPIIIDLFSWIHIDLLDLRFNFLFDSLTVSMLVVVTLISFLVHIYSIEYMKEDPHQIRFFSYISIFTFFMIILITAGNLVQLFIGWEGVGICSYLLINFWYSRLDANKSSVMAMVTNKIGDISLLISFAIIFFIYKSFDFSIINSYHLICYSVYVNQPVLIDFVYIKPICVLFLIGAIGKSAQIGLHVWLPEAMEGPTPVSSLIHAATMVTAGIFLLIRCSFLFHELPSLYLVILLFGTLTTFLGSSIALFQHDIKKIIAYSTCSQLGYMFLACGLLGYTNSIYHLINHAFFKALLFLSAGLIIHCFSHEQDYRKMGSLIFFFPFAYISILIGSLSLIGFPFFSGFYSKEKILQLFFNVFFLQVETYKFLNYMFFFYFLSFISVVFTTLYSIKLLVFVFFVKYSGFKYNLFNIQYGSFYMLLPLFILIYFSIFSGFFTQDLFVGIGTDFWKNSLFIPSSEMEYFFIKELKNIYPHYITLFNYEFYKYLRQVPLVWVLYFTIIFSFFFSVLNTRKYIFNLYFSSFWTFNLSTIFIQKWNFINVLFIYTFIDIFFVFSKFIYFFIEKGLLEKIGPFGISKSIDSLNKGYLITLKGLIYHYLGFILLGLFLSIHFIYI